MLNGTVSVDDVCQSEHIDPLGVKVQSTKESLKGSGTSNLWLQHMTQVDLLRLFRKAERTGYWELHLETHQSMFPHLAVFGLLEFIYSKCHHEKKIILIYTWHSLITSSGEQKIPGEIFHRFSYRTGVNEKFKNKWRID